MGFETRIHGRAEACGFLRMLAAAGGGLLMLAYLGGFPLKRVDPAAVAIGIGPAALLCELWIAGYSTLVSRMTKKRGPHSKTPKNTSKYFFNTDGCPCLGVFLLSTSNFLLSFVLHIHQYFDKMSETIQKLTAPNSLSIEQPIGLFINNEFVKSTSGKKFATINPA